MYSYINSILTYKNKIYNEITKNKVDKNNTSEYLKSCIVFVYKEINYQDIFLTEIGKYCSKEIGKIEKNDNDSKRFENIKIFTSDICGLGKTHKIKKLIDTVKVNNKKQQYFHFPLGGILTKEVIFKKLSELLVKIKIALKEEDNFENIAIHLDLTESEETSIINEFLFSFLITKFYINNGNIIYIPKEMKIYIEIPNCFNDYLSKFGILKVFSFDNIPLSKIPDLDLPQVTIDIFSLMLDYDTNKKIEKFIKEKIGIDKYSFHQVQIFIKLFISQYSKFNCKLKFIDDNDKDVTEECIQEFANSSKYFTAGGFAKLLNDKKRYENDDYKDILTSTYDNDLKGTKFDFPLIFVIKEEKKYIPVKIPNKIQNSKLSDYLKDIKRALNLENDVEKDRGNLKSLNQF